MAEVQELQLHIRAIEDLKVPQMQLPRPTMQLPQSTYSSYIHTLQVVAPCCPIHFFPYCR
ncbi:hypothetical protein GIB67_001970 [Kingdonia uniflora]|uniref:Uncharacterized protein n=1 Tax=Kingdonia uniflora TaxID=39325 RepID=A0A7J7M9Y3_9MAGN|nr:hypothetical protein GIB67_001970 [Kingdonia uniflora]